MPSAFSLAVDLCRAQHGHEPFFGRGDMLGSCRFRRAGRHHPNRLPGAATRPPKLTRLIALATPCTAYAGQGWIPVVVLVVGFGLLAAEGAST